MTQRLKIEGIPERLSDKYQGKIELSDESYKGFSLKDVMEGNVFVDLDMLILAAREGKLRICENGVYKTFDECKNKLMYIGEDGKWRYLYEKEIKCIDFGNALEELKNGRKVARKAWLEKNVFIIFVDKNENYRYNFMKKQNISVVVKPHILIKGPNDTYSIWSPSVEDMFANDWYVVE